MNTLKTKGGCYYFTFSIIQSIRTDADELLGILRRLKVDPSTVDVDRDVRLVHGKGFDSNGEPIDHAWIEIGDFVYDETLDTELAFEIDPYYVKYQIKNHRKFSRNQTL